MDEDKRKKAMAEKKDGPIIVGWKTMDGYKTVEIQAGDQDESRLYHQSMSPGAAMASRQTGRGLYQVLAYPHEGAADLVLTMDGDTKFSFDYRTMKALGLRWRRRWCGKV